jgi:hypothetical protein
MMSSRGMGAINPSKMPKGRRKARRDDTDFDEYAKGGRVKKMAEGDLIEDASIKPTSVITEKDFKRLGARASGSVPLSEKDSLKLSADLSASKMRGQGVRGDIDALRAEYRRKLDKDSEFGASVGRDAGGNRFGLSYRKSFAKGGKTSKVNEAGNYTKPGMRKSLFESIKAQAVQGTAAGQWSARKAQLLAKKYKAKGGGYRD